MARHIKKCLKQCTYTLNNQCPDGSVPVLPYPPKFSLDDKYAAYRREIKKEGLIEKGLY